MGAPLRMVIDSMPGLQDALVALSYFRHRHDKTPRFRKRKKGKENPGVGHFPEMIRHARDHIRKARELGWRGSIREALTQ